MPIFLRLGTPLVMGGTKMNSRTILKEFILEGRHTTKATNQTLQSECFYGGIMPKLKSNGQNEHCESNKGGEGSRDRDKMNTV